MKHLQYTPMTPADDGNGYVDPDGKKWQPLNPKQKKFAREYLKGQNATEAAVKAGYTKNRNAAKRQGSVLLNHNPLLRNYLIDQEIKEAERDRVSMEGHLSALHDLREEARGQGQINAARTAELPRGRVGGTRRRPRNCKESDRVNRISPWSYTPMPPARGGGCIDTEPQEHL